MLSRFLLFWILFLSSFLSSFFSSFWFSTFCISASSFWPFQEDFGLKPFSFWENQKDLAERQREEDGEDYKFEEDEEGDKDEQKAGDHSSKELIIWFRFYFWYIKRSFMLHKKSLLVLFYILIVNIVIELKQNI